MSLALFVVKDEKRAFLEHYVAGHTETSPISFRVMLIKSLFSLSL